MRSRSLAAGLGAALVVATPASAAVTPPPKIHGSAFVEAGVLVFDDRTSNFAPFNVGEQVTLAVSSSADGRFTITAAPASGQPGATYPAGPGCSRTVGAQAVFACDGAGVQRFELRNAPSFGLITAMELDISRLTIPARAALGPADDTLRPQVSVASNVDAGPGRDRLDLERIPPLVSDSPPRFAALRYSNDGVANDGFVGVATTSNWRGFERVQGSPLADNQISGGPENDEIIGLTGNDRLRGGPGDDDITGNGGVDDVNGGEGNDRLRLRDGTPDVIGCENGADTYDLDLTDNAPSVEACTRTSDTPLSSAIARLNDSVRDGNTSAIRSFRPPPTASFDRGAVRERPNVTIPRQLLVARRGRVALRMACPKATRKGCRGTVELRNLRGQRLARADRHRLRAGQKGTTTIVLPRSVASRRGARAVFARVVEQGEFGAKTSGIVLALAVT